MGVHVSPILNPAPTSLPIPSPGLSQCTGFECPFSCIKLGLVIYFTYGNINVSVLFSQIIPPSPSPTESKSLFLHLRLFCCLTYRVIITIFLNSIYRCQCTVLVFFLLTTSLCIIGSSFVHLIRTDSNVFF